MLYLDKRIHRSVRLGGQISLSSAYTVVITASGTDNIITITDTTGANPPIVVTCPNIFTPLNCGTTLTRIFNSTAQVAIDPATPGLDLSIYRFYEVHQVLNNPATGDPTLIIRSKNTSGLPDYATSYLHIQPANASLAETVIPLGDKIPPNLG